MSASQFQRQQLVAHSSSGVRLYRGVNARLGTLVAIKDLSGVDARLAESYCQDAQRWAPLGSSGSDALVGVLDQDFASRVIVTPWVHESAEVRLRNGALSVDLVAGLLIDALEGLDELHRHGVIHGNLKPGNVLLNAKGRAKLADGRAIDVAAQTTWPAPRGSYKYQAPETFKKEFGSLGLPSDLYVLGLVALELLTGPDFDLRVGSIDRDVSERDIAWARWHAQEPTDPLWARPFVANLPKPLGTVIERLLVKAVSQRYQRAEEALGELGQGQVRPGRRTAPDQPSGGAPSNVQAVLRFCSGPRLGEELPIEGEELRIGTEPLCQLPLDAQAYPGMVGREVVVLRAADGWHLQQQTGRGLVVGGRSAADLARPIRSGDIVRVSSRGPDFQFLLVHRGVPTAADLLRKYRKAKGPAEQAAGASHWAAPPPPEPSPAPGAVVAAVVGARPGPVSAGHWAAPSPPMTDGAPAPSPAPAPRQRWRQWWQDPARRKQAVNLLLIACLVLFGGLVLKGRLNSEPKPALPEGEAASNPGVSPATQAGESP